MSHLNGFGPHIMLDLNKCSRKALSSIDACFNLLNTLPDQIGMTKITQPYVFPYKGLVPEDTGITGIVIIAESHISLHTFSEKNYAFIDIFSCKPFNTQRAIDGCIDCFESKEPVVNITERGHSFPRRSVSLEDSHAIHT